MSLTSVEENQVRELLVNFEGLNDLGAIAPDLEAALAVTDTTVLALPAAATITNADVLYLAQAGADTKATAQQFGAFVLSLMPTVPAANPLAPGDIVFVTQTGQTRQSTVGDFANYILSIIPVPPIPYDRTRIYFMSQI